MHVDWPCLTTSRLSDLDCARRYYLAHVARLPVRARPNGSGALGNAFHSVMRRVYDRRFGEGVPFLEHLHAFARVAVYSQADLPEPARAEAIERVLRMAGGYVARDADDPAQILAVEHPIDLILRKHGAPAVPVRVRLDRLLVRACEPDTVVARDYKTGRRQISLEQAALQLVAVRARYGEQYARQALEVDWVAPRARSSGR